MATRARAVAPFTLAALSAAAGLSLGRVFDSGRFVVPVLAAALLPHAVGALGRRLHWSTALTIGVTVLAVAALVLWALLPGTTWFGIPTGSTTTRTARVRVRSRRGSRSGGTPTSRRTWPRSRSR